MQTSQPKLLRTNAAPAVLLIRIMVGAVFLSEGCQKFLFAAQLGAGRFARIGLPRPELLAPLVGSTEILCGIALLLGLWVRITALPLLVVISGAIICTKWPVFVNQGFWTAAHEGRTDFCVVMGLLFLVVRGAGAFSLDARRGRFLGRKAHDAPGNSRGPDRLTRSRRSWKAFARV